MFNQLYVNEEILFEDPLYQTPLVLTAALRLRPVTSFPLYQYRWPVEQVPLAAKHMIGARRQFILPLKVVNAGLNWP